MTPADIQITLAFIKDNAIFNGLSSAQLELLAKLATEVTFNKNEVFIKENEPGEEFYIIKQGKVEIIIHDPKLNHHHRIAIATQGNVLGELALLDNAPRSASVRALKPTTAYRFSIRELRQLASQEMRLSSQEIAENIMLPTYSLVMQNIAKNLSKRLRATNTSVVISMRKQLKHAQARAALSGVIITTLMLSSFYVILLQIIMAFKSELNSSTYITVPLMIFFAIPLFLMMKHSGYSISFYGITTKGWKRAVSESLLFSIPWLVLCVILKIIMIKTVPYYATRHVFDMTLDLFSQGQQAHHTVWFGVAMVLSYLIFTPIQEFVSRGALQSSFQRFLTGKYRIFWSIMLSNLLFSVVHLQISFLYGIIVFIPGLFWGWLYSRQTTLLGAIASHLLLGAWAIFIVGLF